MHVTGQILLLDICDNAITPLSDRPGDVLLAGAVIERSIQRFGGGPVSVVQSDNVVLYHYFNHKTQRMWL